MKDRIITKSFFSLAFACILAALITTLAICALAHNVSAASFNPSQIGELTGNKEGSPELSGKIEEELSELFKKGAN